MSRLFFESAAFTMLGCPKTMMKISPKVLLPFLVLLFVASLSAQNVAEQKAEQHFQAAKEAERAKDLETAVGEYRQVLKLKPEVAEVWVNLGLDLYILNKNDDAVAAFRQALRRNPNLVPANLFLGMAYLRSDQFEKAIPPLKKAIALNPRELKAYINLSFAYQEAGREEEAATILQKADILFPKNTEVLYNLGKTYTKLMEKSYKGLAAVDPDSYRFHQIMGDSYQLRRDYPSAQAEYKKALDKCPDPYLPGLHYSLASSYWMEAKWEPAIEQFKLELQISPDDYLSTWKLGDTYLYQRKYGDARLYLEKVLKEKPDLGQANRDMGKLLIQTGHSEEALPYLLKVAKENPEEASSHFLLAQVYRKTGNTPDMKAELELFQKLKQAESDRSVKHPDSTAMSGIESSTERPQEDESIDDLK